MVANSGILFTGVLIFWGSLIRFCSDLAMPVLFVVIFSVISGVFFSVALSVVFNGLLIIDWLFCIF